MNVTERSLSRPRIRFSGLRSNFEKDVGVDIEGVVHENSILVWDFF